MRWRDIRFEKPTEKDATACGRILQRLFSGAVGIYSWHHHADMVAWMPLSELPQPDLPGPIPDGWRPVDQAVDKKRTDEMFWLNGAWRATSRNDTWDSEAYYIAPIDPPAPQYRPFASAAEFMPHADRWISRSFSICPDHAGGFRCSAFDDYGIWERDKRTSYSELFREGRKFADDGTPFGVKITEATQ
jgi:hypothetical protein